MDRYQVKRFMYQKREVIAMLWDGKDPHIKEGPEVSSLMDLYNEISDDISWERWRSSVRMEHGSDEVPQILVLTDGFGGIATPHDCYIGYDRKSNGIFVMTDKNMLKYCTAILD